MVIPMSRLRLPRARGLAALLAVLAVGACAAPATTFDPAGPCLVDGRTAGAYPDLEARLPAALDGRAPTSVDSGRHCSEAALGSLVAHDALGVQFAGATWDLGNGKGVSSAVFSLPKSDLPAAWIAEFYEIGARTAKRTENLETSRPTFDGTGETWRLDTLNGLSLQTIVTWQDGPIVRVVLVATQVAPDATRAAHDDLVAAAIAASAGLPGSGP